MSDAIAPNTWQIDDNQEATLSEILTEIHRLNERIQEDQWDIDRLKAETRAISSHSDRLLLQIEAQLDMLQKVA